MKKQFNFKMGDVRVYLFAAEKKPAENEQLMQEREELLGGLPFFNMQEGMGYMVYVEKRILNRNNGIPIVLEQKVGNMCVQTSSLEV